MNEYNLTAKDMESLSDADLEHLANGKVDQLSDQALEHVVSRHDYNNSQNPQKAQSQFDPDYVELSNEMHPNIGAWDRFVAKNFASSNPESAIGYLKKKMPDMEFARRSDGEIIARLPGEQQWGRLDEKGFGLQDLTDIATDAGQGAAEAIGGTAAGIATMNPAVGLGAAGALGIGSELAKQGVGTMLGVPDNFSPGDVVISGGASSIVPAVGKYAVKPAWAATKRVMPKLASMATNIPEDLIRNIGADAGARLEIAKNGVTNYVEKFSEPINEGMAKAKKKVGQAVSDSIGTNKVNVAPIKQQLAALQNSVDFDENTSRATKHLIDRVNERPDIVDPITAIQDKNFFHGVGQGDKDVMGYGSTQAMMGDISAPERKLGTLTSKSFRDALKDAAPDKQAFEDANRQASEFYSTYYDDRLKPFAGQNKTQSFLEKYSKPTRKNQSIYNNEFFDKVDNYVDDPSVPKLRDSIRGYQSHEVFENPTKLSEGSTKLAGLGGLLGGATGYLIPGGNMMTSGIGATIGGTAGSFISSPWAVKKAYYATPAIEAGGDSLEKFLYNNNKIKNDKALMNLMMNYNNQ